MSAEDRAAGSTRVDRWLWAVRVTKTRAQAADACKAGHVEVDGATAKASTTVRPGSRVQVVAPGGRVRLLEVVDPIERRVGAPLAAACLVDHSEPPPPRDDTPAPLVRLRGTGRPTKRERRQLDQLRPPR